jgi:hypothetical protein
MLRVSAECVKRRNVFPENIDFFAQMVTSRNTTSGRRLLASSSEQGGLAKISKLGGRTRIPVASKRDEQHVKPE